MICIRNIPWLHRDRAEAVGTQRREIERLEAELARFGEPDLAAFFESLSPVRVGKNGYTALDRYRDFRQVFSTPEGRRVLHQIIDYCEGAPRSEHSADQIYRNIFRDGRRDGSLWIVKMMNAVPLEKAEKAEGLVE